MFASSSGVCSTIVRSGRAGTLSAVASTLSSPTSGWSSSLRICPGSSMSRSSHSRVNSAPTALIRARTSWNPSSPGLAEQAARNWATTVRALCSQLRARVRYSGSVKNPRGSCG
ncbi:hypothetical protein ACH49_13295 [Streptomyces leeuwenhoekii]|uniref:Uncharacterized protein n=1 Tax=Streptomyces leeuwenhoekii TaxID=1437453 RepID=A0ABR5HZ57_STRLW|nr:hypothetical protein ACH49_13295 [Streptomyces leeuwenhoekii]